MYVGVEWPFMKKLLIATRNKGKVRELASLLKGCPYELTTLDAEGIDVDVEETGATLEENASLKAKSYMKMSGLPCLADDSALEVDALGGEPGVMSKRYGGLENATDAARIDFLLKKLENIKVDRRRARFVSVIVIAWPGDKLDLYRGECRGVIVSEPKGENGFGYDPVFYIPEIDKTMAQLSFEEKNKISHRARAAQKALKGLKARHNKAKV